MDDAAYDRLEALGEAREEAGIPEPSDDEHWEGVFTPRATMHEIADNLWMGGGPYSPLALPTRFKHVLSIWPSGQYIDEHDVLTRTVAMDDSDYQPLGGVDELALWVNEARKLGPVLVHCAAGLNRSGVVTARALMIGDNLTGREAINLIREKRDRFALCNSYFEEWILSHDRLTNPNLALPIQSDETPLYYNGRLVETIRMEMERLRRDGDPEAAQEWLTSYREEEPLADEIVRYIASHGTQTEAEEFFGLEKV